MATGQSSKRAHTVNAVRRRFEESVAKEFARRLKGVRFVDAITLFGAFFLLSALPFTILMSSFANRRIDHDLTQHLGLNAEAAHTVEQLFRTSSAHSISAIVLALLLTGAGTVGVAGCVQSIYEQVFGQTRHGPGNLARLMIWLAGLCGWFVVDSLISTATHHLPAHLVLDGICVLLATTAFFCWSMHLLLAGGRPWRSLLRPAVLTAVLWIALEGFAALYFSSTIISDSRLYGSVGVVFSLLTWFIAIAAVVVLGALAGDVWQQRRAASAPGQAAVAAITEPSHQDPETGTEHRRSDATTARTARRPAR
jgi:membrane protein